MSYIYMEQASGHRPLACWDRGFESHRGAWIFVCCECRVLSGRGLRDELITRPEESYRLWCVVVCDLETSRIGAPYIYDISSLRVNLYTVREGQFYLHVCVLLCKEPFVQLQHSKQSVRSCVMVKDSSHLFRPGEQALYFLTLQQWLQHVVRMSEQVSSILHVEIGKVDYKLICRQAA